MPKAQAASLSERRWYPFEGIVMVAAAPYVVHMTSTYENGAEEPALLLDLDGTLVDDTYENALAWEEALPVGCLWITERNAKT